MLLPWFLIVRSYTVPEKPEIPVNTYMCLNDILQQSDTLASHFTSFLLMLCMFCRYVVVVICGFLWSGLGFWWSSIEVKTGYQILPLNWSTFLFLLKIKCPPSPFYLQLFRGFLVCFPFCLSCPFAWYAWWFSPFIYLSKSHLKRKSGKVASSSFFSKYEIFCTQWIGWSVRNTQDIFQTLAKLFLNSLRVKFNSALFV